MADDRASDARGEAATTATTSFPTVDTRRWKGGTKDWYDAANWRTKDATKSYPLPGDTAEVAHGTARLVGSEAKNNGLFAATDVVLGSTSTASATLEADRASLGTSFAITAKGHARLLAKGTSTYDGHLTLDSGVHMTLGAKGSGDLILARGFGLSTATEDAKADLTVSGHVTLDGVGVLATPKSVSLTNDGTVDVVGLANVGTTGLQGAVKGTGTFELGLASDLKTAGRVGSGQTFDFASRGAELDIGKVQAFAGAVTNFRAGDILGLTNVAYSDSLAAHYDAATSTLKVTDTSTHHTVARIADVSARAGALSVAKGASGGVSIGYSSPPSAAVSKANIAGSDAAMNADAARTLDAPGTGAPITGAGEKIGIISNSFDNTGTAAANEAAGYLPAVDVLADDPSGKADDEGQAMAQEVHQVAPGAQIDFCAADDGTTSETQQTFAQAVQALQKDHCTVIVDDISFAGAPHYQVAGPAADAVQAAVADGVDYFSSTGNEGQAFLNQTFKPSATKVRGQEAQTFDNGTPYERITVAGTSNPAVTTKTAYLQWAAPYENPNGGNAPQDLKLELFDAKGKYISSSKPITISDPAQGASPVEVSAASLRIPTSKTTQSYYFAVVRNDGEPAPSRFNVTLQVGGTGTGPGGVIDDPKAGFGSDVAGTKIVPGVNSVGASFYGESAAFGQQPTANEGFSSYGGQTQILYAPNGTALPSPQDDDKPAFTAPDGTVTTVPGSFAGGFFGTSAAAPNAAAVAALMLQADPQLTTRQVTRILERTATAFGNPDQSGAGLIDADRAVEAAIAHAEAACFAAGTRIATTRGDIAVEALAVGDLVVTAHGRTRAIRWLGHRSLDCRRALRPADVRPVRIAAHAFGPNRPARDLRVSPGHAVCLDVLGEMLMPAGALVDGVSIVQEAVDHVTYWHVELDTHDVILAENLPAESYLDTGNRGFFAEHAVTTLHAPPDAAVCDHTAVCRPFAAQGPAVDAVRRRLAARRRQAAVGAASPSQRQA